MKPNTSGFTFTSVLSRACAWLPRAGHAHMLLVPCGASQAAPPAPPPRHVTNTLLNASASMRWRANSGDQPLAAATCARASAGAPLAPGSPRAGSCSGAGCAAATAALPRGGHGVRAAVRCCGHAGWWPLARCWRAAPAPARAWRKPCTSERWQRVGQWAALRRRRRVLHARARAGCRWRRGGVHGTAAGLRAGRRQALGGGAPVLHLRARAAGRAAPALGPEQADVLGRARALRASLAAMSAKLARSYVRSRASVASTSTPSDRFRTARLARRRVIVHSEGVRRRGCVGAADEGRYLCPRAPRGSCRTPHAWQSRPPACCSCGRGRARASASREGRGW